jgi:hypothetical protein
MVFCAKVNADGIPSIPPCDEYRRLVALAFSKHNGFLMFNVTEPFQPRTVGWKSQNHHLRGHCRQIAKYCDLTMSEVHNTIKDELADWPERMIEGPRGARIIKASEADISMEVCAAAIEVCHAWAAHLGFVLIEGKRDE